MNNTKLKIDIVITLLAICGTMFAPTPIKVLAFIVLILVNAQYINSIFALNKDAILFSGDYHETIDRLVDKDFEYMQTNGKQRGYTDWYTGELFGKRCSVRIDGNKGVYKYIFMNCNGYDLYNMLLKICPIIKIDTNIVNSLVYASDAKEVCKEYNTTLDSMYYNISNNLHTGKPFDNTMVNILSNVTSSFDVYLGDIHINFDCKPDKVRILIINNNYTKDVTRD